jgi:hypothetical protein
MLLSNARLDPSHQSPTTPIVPHCNHKEKHLVLLIAIEFAEKTQLCLIATLK